MLQAFNDGFLFLAEFLRKFFTGVDSLGGLAHLVTTHEDGASKAHSPPLGSKFLNLDGTAPSSQI